MTVDYAAAKRHLMRRCPTLKPHVHRIGPCTLQPQKDSFAILCSSIISQQISTKAAYSIKRNVRAALGGRFQPARFHRVEDETLRSCGLSAGKVRFLRDLVYHVEEGNVPIRKLTKLDDDEIRDRLLIVKGIGPWTVDMFLMFGLGRPDVLPVGDLGIKAAVKKWWSLTELPTVEELTEIAEPWRPFRSIASWYLWRSLGPVPQSK